MTKEASKMASWCLDHDFHCELCFGFAGNALFPLGDQLDLNHEFLVLKETLDSTVSSLEAGPSSDEVQNRFFQGSFSPFIPTFVSITAQLLGVFGIKETARTKVTVAAKSREA